MGKIVATYLVKVTLREPDDVAEGEKLEAPPTNDQMAEFVTDELDFQLARLTVNATSERTDI